MQESTLTISEDMKRLLMKDAIEKCGCFITPCSTRDSLDDSYELIVHKSRPPMAALWFNDENGSTRLVTRRLN